MSAFLKIIFFTIFLCWTNGENFIYGFKNVLILYFEFTYTIIIYLGFLFEGKIYWSKKVSFLVKKYVKFI
jgi:hypothetical protein